MDSYSSNSLSCSWTNHCFFLIATGDSNPSDMIILFPYKYWWLSLSIIALVVWKKNIAYYFGSVGSEVTVKKPSEFRLKMDHSIRTKFHQDYSAKNCNDCGKEFSFVEQKYSSNNSAVCFDCLKKSQKFHLGLNISSGQLTGEKAQYSEKELTKFRMSLVKSMKEALVFSPYKWFIKNYIKDNKVDKKTLNLFLDCQLDGSPDYLGEEEVAIDKDLMIIILNKSLRFNEEEFAKEIKKKNKWDLLVNFVKQNIARDTGIASEAERKKLINILSKYDIIVDDTNLHLILASIHGELEYEAFKNKVKQKKPTDLDDYLDVFLEIYGENYKSHMWFLASILYDNNLLNEVGLLKPLAERRKEKLEIESYERKLSSGKLSEQKIDFLSMSGHQFEFFLGDLFKKMGYKVVNTKLSGDQGADLIIEKFGEKIAVQAKNYNQPVSNGAVQEAVASKSHYNCQNAMVVTTNGYTKSAISLAKSNNVELWDKEKLLKEIKKYF